LAGDQAWLRDGELSVQIPCAKPLDAGELLHPEAYRDEDGRHWTRLPGPRPANACSFEKGRWRYDQVPMSLQQSP
jgi:hypothetical protein